MSSFFNHIYTPQSATTYYSTATNIQLNSQSQLQNNNKLKYHYYHKSQVSQGRQIRRTDSKQYSRKPRASAFQLYKNPEIQDDIQGGSEQMFKTIDVKQGFDSFGKQATKYFNNNNPLKKVSSEQQITSSTIKMIDSSRYKQTGDQIKTAQKPTAFQKYLKASVNNSALHSTKDESNLKQRLKSPPLANLKQEFKRILDNNNSTVSERKASKSMLRGYKEKVVLTKEGLQIQNLKHSISNVEKAWIKEKLSWFEQEKMMIASIHKMEKEIADLRQENSYFKQSNLAEENNALIIKIRKLEVNIDLRDTNIRELQNENILLNSTFLSLQGALNDLSTQFYSEKNSLLNELSNARQSNLASSAPITLMYGQNSNSFLENQNEDHSARSVDQSQQIKKEDTMKDQYIRTLQTKNEAMGKQLTYLKSCGSKLHTVQKLLGQNNQNIFKFCLRRLDQGFLNFSN